MMRVLLLLAVVIGSVGCASNQSLKSNKDLVLALQDEVWSRGNLDLVDTLIHPDFVCHSPVGPDWHGPEGVKEQVVGHRVAFPDWNERVVQIVAENNVVATRFVSSGTNLGEFGGSPPTGNRVEITEMATFRIADGKIIEQWFLPDLLLMQRQLHGAAP